jgi:NAD(P)-dependent dehydrogenase (short-subunit alcohol dehydrogenase family)
VVIPAHTSYSVSKAAIDQVTRHLAVELGPHQIRSNAVKPTVARGRTRDQGSGKRIGTSGDFDNPKTNSFRVNSYMARKLDDSVA